jgi:hypothetical protein
MKKERQTGVRVGLPVFFVLELEDVYKHFSGAHRALAFPDFLGLLIGLGLEEYRRAHGTKPEAPDFTPERLRELSEDYEEAMRLPRFRELEDVI